MPAPVSAGVMSTLSSRRIISPAIPMTRTDSAFCTRRPSVCARLVRSITLSPVPRLISRSNRRAAADPMRIAKYAATAMMTMRRPASRIQRTSASGLPPKLRAIARQPQRGEGERCGGDEEHHRGGQLRRGRSTNWDWISRSSIIARRTDWTTRATMLGDEVGDRNRDGDRYRRPFSRSNRSGRSDRSDRSGSVVRTVLHSNGPNDSNDSNDPNVHCRPADWNLQLDSAAVAGSRQRAAVLPMAAS